MMAIQCLNLITTQKKKLLENRLPKISNKCCYYLKKLPFHEYEKATNRKAILGIMTEESLMRKKPLSFMLYEKR